jgi:hypothetical protein
MHILMTRMLRRMLRQRMEKVTGVRGKLNNMDLHNLYSSPDILMIIKRILYG